MSEFFRVAIHVGGFAFLRASDFQNSLDGVDNEKEIAVDNTHVMWKYYRPLGNTLSIELYVGPSLELAIKERTKTKRLSNFYDPQHELRYDYVFYEGDDPWPWLSRSGFNVNGGIAIGWSVFTLELRYSRALHDVDVISGLAMTEKLDFLQFLIGLRI